MSQVKVNTIVDASGGTTATINGYTPTVSNMAGRNRIINGDMRIDQRNAGAAVTLTSFRPYCTDRWYGTEDTDGAATLQQVTDAPAGFTNSLKFTTTTADASLAATQFARVGQIIEGLNVSDLGWGTANAQTVTLSFKVKSSLSGTFGGAVTNAALNRSYPFTYVINSANTWEDKTVTIPGDTSGTWLTTNGEGINLQFGMGVGSTYSGTAGSWASTIYVSATGAVSVIGTLNATWQVTGVQLEAGSVATPFERRDYGRELMMCQRYFCSSFDSGNAPANNKDYELGGVYTNCVTYSNANGYCPSISFPVYMRTPPTVTPLSTSLANTDNKWAWYNGAFTASVTSQVQGISNGYFGLSLGSANAFPANGGVICVGAWMASAEL